MPAIPSGILLLVNAISSGPRSYQSLHHRYCYAHARYVGRWALGVGRWALGVRRWALGVGRWALGVGRWAFGVRPSFGVGRSMLDFRYLPRLTTYRRIGSVKELAKLAATVAE
jgi:hypothetical protein